MKIRNEITIQKTSTFIEYIIVWCWIKCISFLVNIVCLNLVFNHKCHVAEWKWKIFFEYEPIMIFAIKSLTSIICELRITALLVWFFFKLLIIVYIYRTFLINKFNTIILNQVNMAIIIPKKYKRFFSCGNLFFYVLSNIPYDDSYRLVFSLKKNGNNLKIGSNSDLFDLNIIIFVNL